jgi:predicted nucleic acid-binding Zn ribbon protein
MAKYVYYCAFDDETLELEYPIGTAPERQYCYSCEGWMKKVIFPAAVSFKGSGFYRTDNPKTKHVRSKVDVK